MPGMSCSCRWLFVLAVLAAPPLKAQYYDSHDYEPSTARYFYAGVMNRDFVPLASNTALSPLAIRFNRLMPMLGFRQGPADVAIGYTRYTLHGGSRTSWCVDATAANEFPLSGKRPGALLLPLMLSLDYMKAEALGLARENFDVASIGIGGGLKYRYYGDETDFSLQAVEIAYYSLEGFSTGSGFSAATVAEAAFQWKNVLVLDGVVLGYRFRFQTWSMGDSRFNYRSIVHGPFIGILF